MRLKVNILFLSIGLSVAGCTVGPNYQRPNDPSTQPSFLGAREAASASRITADRASLAMWWTTLHDATLDSLINRALDQNLGIAEAQALVRQARAQRTISQAAGVPSFDASGGATRSRTTGREGRSTSNLFQAGFDAGWEIDVFGGIRRDVEASDAALQASADNVRNVRVTLLAEVATTYVDLRAAQQQLEIASRNLASQKDSLRVTQEKEAGGILTRLDVANAQAQVDSTAALMPTYETTIRQSMYALATLLGQQPDSLIAKLSPVAPLDALPGSIPAGLPSDLLQRRPDIRIAEANLHAATARIGVATASLYPQFSLTGSFGLQGPRASSLGTLADRFWSIGPAIDWSPFQGGAVRANIEQQRALTDAAVAKYKSTILNALAELESNLTAYDREQQRTLALDDGVTASNDAARLATELYQNGKTDFINVLNAQRVALEAESNRLESRRLALTDLIAIYKSLGGGWETRDLPASEPTVRP